MDHLPSTATQLVAVPEPLGGTLVLCTNHLLYFNQSVKYGMILNEYPSILIIAFFFFLSLFFYLCCIFDLIRYAKREMGTFPLDEAKPIISLDNAVCVFISENCVLISLKTGELYPLLHLRLSLPTYLPHPPLFLFYDTQDIYLTWYRMGDISGACTLRRSELVCCPPVYLLIY